MRWQWLGGAALFAACAGGAPNRADTATSEATAKPTVTSVPSAAPTSAPSPAASERIDAGARAVPPLSTPNARPSPSAATDSGASPGEPTEANADPRLAALRRAGQAAQACYDKSGLARGTAGKLHARLSLRPDGSVERVEIDRAQSASNLVGGKLEQCVVAALKQEKFVPLRSGDVVLELPLEFRPVK